MLKDLYKKTMDIVLVNFLWIFASLLGVFITLGASTKAMFQVMYKIINADGPTSVLKDFWKAFKEEFWKSTLVWVVLVIIAIPLYYMYIYNLNVGNDLLVIIAIVGFYQLSIFFIYFYPTFAVLKTETLGQMIKNVLYIANKNLWINFKVLGSLVFVVILVLYVHIAFIVIAVGIYGFLVAFQLNSVYKPYIASFKEEFESEELK